VCCCALGASQIPPFSCSRPPALFLWPAGAMVCAARVHGAPWVCLTCSWYWSVRCSLVVCWCVIGADHTPVVISCCLLPCAPAGAVVCAAVWSACQNLPFSYPPHLSLFLCPCRCGGLCCACHGAPTRLLLAKSSSSLALLLGHVAVPFRCGGLCCAHSWSATRLLLAKSSSSLALLLGHVAVPFRCGGLCCARSWSATRSPRIFYMDSDVLLFANITDLASMLFRRVPILLSVRWPRCGVPPRPRKGQDSIETVWDWSCV